jgi:CDP-diacylglycerol--serine O-phosphatidyltransferase
MTPAPARRGEPTGRRGVRRAVVMLPNGFSLFHLFCGIYAIILALHDQIAAAPGFIVLGGIADALDGRVARATGTGSRFGEELDSLVDAISFGFAPALIVYLGRPVALQGNFDWLLVFIYTACAVMRLARFNVEQAGRKKTYFHGLPSPAAGLTLATYYWFSQTPLYNETVILFTDSVTLAQLPWHNLLRGLMAMLAALMISDVPYPAMPSIGFSSVKKALGTILVIGAIALLIFSRKEFIFPALLAYVLYGLVKYVIIGFLGRGSSPDEIFWEREAELHQEDEARSAFDRPHIGQEALEEIADEDDEEIVRTPREGRSLREGREPRERGDRQGRKSREDRKPKRRDEARRDEPRRKERSRDESRRDEPRREETRAREPQPEQAPRGEQPRPDVPRRVDDRKAEAVAIENEPELALPDGDSEEGADEVERREPGRKPDDETQVRKRRRRRGRGSRNRADRAAQGEASGGEGADEQVAAAPSGGDVPPGPSLPDTPDSSGNTE